MLYFLSSRNFQGSTVHLIMLIPDFLFCQRQSIKLPIKVVYLLLLHLHLSPGIPILATRMMPAPYPTHEEYPVSLFSYFLPGVGFGGSACSHASPVGTHPRYFPDRRSVVAYYRLPSCTHRHAVAFYVSPI